MNSIKPLIPRDFVANHPERYWGGDPNPSYEKVDAAVISQLSFDGFDGVDVYSLMGWHVVGCDVSWSSYIDREFGGIKRVFSDSVGLPKSGPNDLRIEWFLAVLAKCVVVLVDGKLEFASHECGRVVPEELIESSQSRVCIAYQLATGVDIARPG